MPLVILMSHKIPGAMPLAILMSHKIPGAMPLAILMSPRWGFFLSPVRACY